jgi:photosystem II stability/assembly factor-like uncharacterized protein
VRRAIERLVAASHCCHDRSPVGPGLSIRFSLRWFAVLVLLVLLNGCEAPLKVDAVEQRLDEPIRRSDQFQMATANKNAIVVVGNQGLVVISADEGKSWQRDKLPGWPELIGVTTCPGGAFAALAAEGQVWVSANDGGDWTRYALDSEEAPQAITCDSQNRIWVVGSFSSIFSSADAGASWEISSMDEDTIFTNIQFVDAQTAFISGEFGTLLKTTDAGLTWVSMPALANEFYPQAMRFADSNRGWIVGLQGQILYTEDGGEHWAVQQTDTHAPLYGIEQAGTDLYAVGGEGMVLKKNGQHWTTMDHGQAIFLYLRAVLPVGKDRLLVAGQAGALYLLPTDVH